MKKTTKIFLTLVTAASLCTLCTGCNYARDNIPATASIQSTNGTNELVNSINYHSGMSANNVRREICSPRTVTLSEGESCCITFYCSSCGKKDVETVDYPTVSAQVWHCDCPEEIDENNHSREYISIKVDKE